jgi:DNA-binding transcriptional MerR regulator
MRTSELARRAGVGVETLRYYERRGLLEQPQRSLGGHRQYPDEAVATVRAIKAAQRLGFTLEEVGPLLDAGSAGHNGAALQRSASAKLAEVDERIAELQGVARRLRATIAAECDSLPNCAAPSRG